VTSSGIKPSARVAILGLDGATWTNLRAWVERGEMPVLARLMSDSAWGVLNSATPALTPPAWTSLITGTNPGKHGIYHFRHQPAGDYYQRRLNNSRDIAAPTIWQRLNQHGLRTGAFNVPLSHPVYPVNGFMTSDALSPEARKLYTHPPELAEQFPGYVIDVLNYPEAVPGTANHEREMLAFVEENERVMLHHADVAVRLMTTQAWQFFMAVWLVLDRMQHFAWKYCDPAVAETLTGETEKKIAARTRQLFKKLDAQIGRFVEAAGKDTTLLLVSDHGFGPIPQQFFHTNRWLVEQGYLGLLSSFSPERLVYGNLPRAWKPKLGAPIDSKHGIVDWSRTKAWADPLESRATGIRINRKNRYAEGIVADTDVEPLLEELTRELLALKAPDGSAQFAEVHRGDKLYRGPHGPAGPDLVAILSKPFDVPPSFRRDVKSPQCITPNRHVMRDGGHEPEGVVLLHGRHVRRGGWIPPQPIESIAPTVLQLFGLPVADGMDAEPISSALEDEFVQAHPARRASESAAPITTPASGGQAEYSAEDSAVVEERLRKLGYLD
jgi:predicted AlkP superfamily phosphohydrolase/phosphomutase